MFIAHLPAGFLLTRSVLSRTCADKRQYKWLLAVGLVGSIFPDLDMLYFYLIDNRQHLHHSYWTHLPVFWAIVAMTTLGAAKALRLQGLWMASLVFFPNFFMHLFLDTIVGHIYWLYPLSYESFAFFEVPARYGWWVWNFVLHWSFALEIGLWLWASAVLALSGRRKRRVLTAAPIAEYD